MKLKYNRNNKEQYRIAYYENDCINTKYIYADTLIEAEDIVEKLRDANNINVLGIEALKTKYIPEVIIPAHTKECWEATYNRRIVEAPHLSMED